MNSADALFIEVGVGCEGNFQVRLLVVFLSEKATCEGSTVDGDRRCSPMHVAREEIPQSA